MSTLSLNRNLINKSLYDQVQSTWFGAQDAEQNLPSEEASKIWFNGGDKASCDAFDARLTSEFLPALKSLYPDTFTLPAPPTSHAEELAQTSTIAAPFLPDLSPPGPQAATNALSLVVLLDQISRNTHRASQGVIYSHFDRISRAILRTVTSSGLDLHQDLVLKWYVAKRMWFLMPLMHSEHLEDHARLRDDIAALRADNLEKWGEEDEPRQKTWNMLLDFEERHSVILRQFGRYPYRNEAMGRQSTEEEGKWLADGGERFTS